MCLTDILSDKKTITVSGLHSGIGKTLFSSYIISMVKSLAAIKITINDSIIDVTDDEQEIMVKGKDTYRFKINGAKKVVWVRSTEAGLKDAFCQAVSLVQDYKKLLIEGNNILTYIEPQIAFFLCDERIIAGFFKESRLRALKKADIIINNIRDDKKDASVDVENFCRTFNNKAQIISINISDEPLTKKQLLSFLRQKGIECVSG